MNCRSKENSNWRTVELYFNPYKNNCIFIAHKKLRTVLDQNRAQLILRHNNPVFCMDGTVASLSVNSNFLWNYSYSAHTIINWKKDVMLWPSRWKIYQSIFYSKQKQCMFYCHIFTLYYCHICLHESPFVKTSHWTAIENIKLLLSTKTIYPLQKHTIHTFFKCIYTTLCDADSFDISRSREINANKYCGSLLKSNILPSSLAETKDPLVSFTHWVFSMSFCIDHRLAV